MTPKPAVPTFRRPSDVVFGDTPPPPAPEPAPAPAKGTARVEPLRQRKTTVYFSDAELAELDLHSLELRAATGVHYDRGRIIRAALALALRDKDRLNRALAKGEGA